MHANGACDVVYDDKSKESAIPACFIRAHQELCKLAELKSCENSQHEDIMFAPGTNVMVKWKYQWFPAVVIKSQFSSTRQRYLVQYVDRKQHKTMSEASWLNMKDVRRLLAFQNTVNSDGKT